MIAAAHFLEIGKLNIRRFFRHFMQKELAVLVWGQTDNAAEKFGEMLGIFQSYQCSDIGQCQSCVRHQLNCLVNPVEINIVQDGKIHMLEEYFA